ncbi:MAG: NAD(P)(+) transhydrogenase (Re/Si-specific) subunit beta [Spirochaetes bacterium]|nr:NAD(P)(+) transhydrogenase (Re/Si-specific) subunit beta [Spirochaetota bacterium]
MNLSNDIYALIYLVASILFIFGLKGLASPKSAILGNTLAMTGMAIAVIATAIHPDVTSYWWTIAMAAGGIIGYVIAKKITMTSMPELVAAFHSLVGLAAVFIAVGTYFKDINLGHIEALTAVELSLGSAIGALTFSGSVIAFGKLKGTFKFPLFSSNPVKFPGQHFVNLIMILGIIGLCVYFSINSDSLEAFLILTAIAFILGVTMIIPIGGADMPVVVSMLNSYSGWAASATGFTLNNNLLILTGALVGSSGAILSYIMCKAMNRSFISVILGGFGGESADSSDDTQVKKNYKSAGSEDVAYMMENSSKVIIVPGYGMAVSQAQHTVKDLWQSLSDKGVEVKFAIHPVAGRMPGHMNVLLAEADIPYDVVLEMDEVNSEFPTYDVALIIGANDIVNPDALTNKSSPLYGMPILEVHKAMQVFICKRSMNAGYAGVDNSLFYYENASMVFGDAKQTIQTIVNAIKGTGH